MRRRTSLPALGALAAAILLALPASAQDPTKVAPEMYKSLMENDRVRVLEVTVPPGGKIGTHSHPDHLAYVISGDKLTITGADGKAMENAIKPGDTLWLNAQTHSAVNNGKTAVRIVVVELKEPAKKM